MFFQSDAGPIYYDLSGPRDRLGLIFTHGGGLNGHMFDAQVAALKHQYRTVIWDMQGHGRSMPLKENFDVPKMARCLMDMMHELQIQQAVLVGHSLGAWVSQLAAVKHPERVKALVSIAGGPIDKPIKKTEQLLYRISMAISRIIPENALFGWTAKQKTTTEQARIFFEKSLKQMGKKQFLLMLGGMLDAASIKVDQSYEQPLLITHGAHEMPKSVIRDNKDWHASVPGSDYFEIAGAGHNANMDKPEAFNQVLVDFLAGL